jgi:hypothetical protein
MSLGPSAKKGKRTPKGKTKEKGHPLYWQREEKRGKKRKKKEKGHKRRKKDTHFIAR